MTKVNENLFLSGLEKYLLEQSGVTEVKSNYGLPVSHAQILSWERSNHVTLPDDVRQFYMSHDGASLIWHCTYNRGEAVGNIIIKSLKQLIIYSPQIDSSLQQREHDKWSPLECNGSNIIIFSSCQSCGHTCLAFDEMNVFKGVWLIDLSLSCHLLSSTFSDYLRLAQVHLGLIQWPYALTNYGLSTDYEVWFEIFAPLRLSLDRNDSALEQSLKNQTIIDHPNFEKLANRKAKN